MGLAVKGLDMGDLPSANAVWGAYLKERGYSRHVAPLDHEDGLYTVDDFARDHPQGTYILAIDGHVVCVRDGMYMDSWDSGHELPAYYWTT